MRPDERSRNEHLARVVAAALQRPKRDSLVRALIAGTAAGADYEASVRGGADAPLRAGRMMIERASPEILRAIASAVDVVLPPAASDWLALAPEHGLPIIVGWDLRDGSGQRCVKLYINASDAAAAVRAKLCAALAPGCNESPAVLGLNARADGVIETKLYLQAADAVALADGLGRRVQALAEAARAEGADAGGVLSLDAGATVQPRAFFVALREPPGGDAWQCVRSLPGYDRRTIAALLPFPPAAPRSVGVGLSDTTWTLYFKPEGTGRAPEALEPTAVFRGGDVEVGVFVEPTAHAVRAFRRTAHHAVSVRVRAGAPVPEELESLVDWFTARLHTAEIECTEIRRSVTDPPAPWQFVQATEAAGQEGERA
jgi:hypothetical protein